MCSLSIDGLSKVHYCLKVNWILICNLLLESVVNVKTWATEEKRKANGFASIESFMKKRRGWPKKRISLQMARASGKAATVANQNQPIVIVV